MEMVAYTPGNIITKSRFALMKQVEKQSNHVEAFASSFTIFWTLTQLDIAQNAFSLFAER